MDGFTSEELNIISDALRKSKISMFDEDIIDSILHHSQLNDENVEKVHINVLRDCINGKFKIMVSEAYLCKLIDSRLNDKFEVKEINKNKKYIVKKIAVPYKLPREIAKIDNIDTEPEELRNLILVNKMRKECLCKHELITMKGKLLVFSYSYKDYKSFIISANYCTNCKQYYSTRTELKLFLNTHAYIIATKCCDEDDKNIILHKGKVIFKGSRYGNYKSEHFIHVMGYNVSDKALDNCCRFNILKYIIEKFNNYQEVKRHIEDLIEERRNTVYKGVLGEVHFAVAISKWEEDLKKIIEYQTAKYRSTKTNTPALVIKNK